jgi:hypothetical protein
MASWVGLKSTEKKRSAGCADQGHLFAAGEERQQGQFRARFLDAGG